MLLLKDLPNVCQIRNAYTLEVERKGVCDRILVIEMDKYSPLPSRKLTIKEVLKLGLDISNALEYMRIKRLVHRDLKPENILVGIVNGVVTYYLSDFGVTRSLFRSDTMTDINTLHFLPDEEHLNPTHTSDLFLLGKTMALLLDDRDMHPSRDALCQVITKASARTPYDRYHRAEDMHADLLEIYESLSDLTVAEHAFILEKKARFAVVNGDYEAAVSHASHAAQLANDCGNKALALTCLRLSAVAMANRGNAVAAEDILREIAVGYGDPIASYHYFRLLDCDLSMADDQLKKASDGGFPPAMYDRAVDLYNSGHEEESIALLVRAVRAGYPEAWLLLRDIESRRRYGERLIPDLFGFDQLEPNVREHMRSGRLCDAFRYI